MARRTIRINVPSNKPDEYSKLLNKILQKHTSMGTESPFANDPDIDMALFAANLEQADGFREQSEDLRKQSENLMQQARKLYGVDKGQGIDTPGTLLYTLDLIRSALLKKYKGNEEALGEFGFDIVIGTAKAKTSKSKAA
jgi:hypothetical protein